MVQNSYTEYSNICFWKYIYISYVYKYVKDGFTNSRKRHKKLVPVVAAGEKNWESGD